MSSDKKIDAGWNDPPEYLYSNSVQDSTSPKKSRLNKRVAFPLNSDVNPNIKHIDPTVAPVFNSNLPPPPPKNPAILAPCSMSNIDSMESTEQMSRLSLNDSDKSPSTAYEDKSHVDQTKVILDDALTGPTPKSSCSFSCIII